MKKTISSLINRANCAAIAILGAITANAELVKEPIYDAENVSVGYKVTGLNDGKEEAVVFTNHLRTATWTVPATLTNVQFLVVGGGGGGGAGTQGPGGGGGGVVTGKVYSLSKGSVVLAKVGIGGKPGINNATGGSKGENSYFSVDNVTYVTAYAGGAGRSSRDGGSGGGGSPGYLGGSATQGKVNEDVINLVYDIEKFGYAGGDGFKTSNSNVSGGGGGGALGVGGTPTSKTYGGTGGPGLPCDITGTLLTYGSGGGGSGSSGSSGGDGAGKGGNPASSGKANQGGGGGGGFGYGGDGGSGIVVLRYALPAEVVAKIGETEYVSIPAAIAAANEGDTIKVIAEANVDAAIEVAKKITIDLNGQTVRTTDKDTVGDGVFHVVANGNLTINDTSADKSGVVNGVGGNDYNIAIWADGGKVTINGGTFTNVGATDSKNTPHFDLIYAKNGGEVVINGGYFKCETPNFTLNCKDADYKANNASIVVNGGTFYQFNPSNNAAEGADTNFCAEGYAGLPNLNDEFVVGVKPTATVKNLGAMTIPGNEYSIYDGNKLTTGTEPMPLNFVMQFVANQNANDMLTSPFAQWYADFVITFEGIEDGSFDATGCYLAGYYGSTDSWDGLWVKIPVDGILDQIDEGVRYPVMLGVNMAQTYTYICSGVQAFSCAMYIPDEILKANPNLKVKLELNVVDSSEGEEAASNALVNGENVFNASETEYTVEDFEEKVQLPEVEVVDIKSSLKDSDPDLTFALNFKIKDLKSLTPEYLEKLFDKYGDYYTDYVLTISGLSQESVTFNANGGADGYLAGQYDAWSKNWVSVPFKNVTIQNGQSLYIMEYAAKQMGKTGLRFTLREVAEIVQNFNCGVYFTPEFLLANPDLEVNLELKVFTEDEEGKKIDDISVATNKFDKEDFSVKAAKLDIRIVDGTPQIGFEGEGTLVLNAAAALTGEWTKNISYTVVENDGDDTKTWVTPAEGCYFFKGFITK